MVRNLFPVLFCLLVLVSPAFAQDITPEVETPTAFVTNTPSVEETPAVEPPVIPPVKGKDPLVEVPALETVGGVLAATLLALFASVLSSPVTSTITAWVKRIPIKFFQETSSERINYGVAGVLAVGTWIAAFFGFGVQFETVLKLILAVSSVLMLPVVQAKASAFYYEHVASGAPYVGTSRADDRYAGY